MDLYQHLQITSTYYEAGQRGGLQKLHSSWHGLFPKEIFT